LTCGGIRLSPIQSWPGAPCPGCAEGQLRRYFLIIEDSQAKKVEEAVWRAMVIGPVAVAELLPPAVISVVPAPRFGRAGAFVTWMHPVSVISAMAVHNIRNAFTGFLRKTMPTMRTKGTYSFNR